MTTLESFDETTYTEYSECDSRIDLLSNSAPSELITSAKQQCENLDEAARAQKIAAAQRKVLQIAAKLKGIGLCAEVVDEDVSVAQLRR